MRPSRCPGSLGCTCGQADGAGAAKRPEQHAELGAHLVQANRRLGVARI